MKASFNLAVLLTVILWGFSSATCPDPNVCWCNDTVIQCNCTSRETLDIPTLIDTRLIRVEHCGNVYIKLGVFASTPIKEIIFDDIQELTLESISVYDVHQISLLSIRNVANLVIESSGLSTLQETGSIEFHNVTINRLLSKSIENIRNVRSFLIIDSKIGTIDSDAIELVSGNHFQMVNTTVTLAMKNSINIAEFEDVLFQGNMFGQIENNTMTVSTTEYLSLKDCDFGEIGSSFLANSSVDNFRFENNIVQRLKSKAFHGLHVSNKIVLAWNNILDAEEDSLIPNQAFSGKGLELDVRNNSFVCNTNIDWLWDDQVYEILLDNGYCSFPEELTGKPLVSYRPKNDAVKVSSKMWLIVLLQTVMILKYMFSSNLKV